MHLGAARGIRLRPEAGSYAHCPPARYGEQGARHRQTQQSLQSDKEASSITSHSSANPPWRSATHDPLDLGIQF